MCGPGGALEAAAQAQRDGRVRFIGLTGHHDPAVLVEAMRRFPFDSLLVSINPADSRYRPFLPTAVAEARRQGMGVVGMKVLAAGRLVREAPAAELIRYGAAHADTVIVGCSSVDEVRANLAVNDAVRTDGDRRTARPRTDDRGARRSVRHLQGLTTGTRVSRARIKATSGTRPGRPSPRPTDRAS